MANETQNDPAPPSESPKPADPRSRIVDGLLQLAAERSFDEISIRDICAAANVSLADFRDFFPSKGAVLAGYTRRVDRKVLAETAELTAADSARDRLFDVLMRRFDAMAAHRDGLRGVHEWLRLDPMAMFSMNQATVNSMRFMLEAVGIDSDGMVGTVKLQGLALAYARVFAIWLEDSEPEFAKTMAALDRELTQGERWISGVEQIDRLASPLRAFARAAMDSRSRARDAFRRRPRETPPGEAGAL